MRQADCAHHSIIRSIVNTNSVDVRGEAKALRLHCIGVATLASPAKFAMEDSVTSHINIAINGLQSALLDTSCFRVGALGLFQGKNDAIVAIEPTLTWT